MASYPSRVLAFAPLAPHGIERVVQWLGWCKAVEHSLPARIGGDLEATFTPVGAAWTSPAVEGAPVLMAGIDEAGRGIVAIRSDLLDADAMRVIHLRFGALYRPAPPHELGTVPGWDAHWQTVEVPLVAEGPARLELDRNVGVGVERILGDAEWAVAVGLAGSAREAHALASRIGLAWARAWNPRDPVPSPEGDSQTEYGALAAIGNILAEAGRIRAELVILERVRGSLRAKAATPAGIESLRGVRDPEMAETVLRIVRTRSDLPDDESGPGVLSGDRIGHDVGRWQVRALRVEGELTYRLTPMERDKPVQGA